MATYTENYNLKKPTYAEPANVKDINDNMEKIDDVMHSTQISLADAYDLNSTYNTGDKVMYELLMYKCKEDGVTGAWDASKWERTTAVEGSGGADLDIYGEASGTAEASFSDGAEASLVECEIGIVPAQDLHGYSKPWAGGAGKNKYIGSPSFDEYANISTYQVSGETYQGHNVIYKSTAWQGAYKADLPLNAGVTYTFSAMVKMSTTANVRIYMETSTLVATVEVGTTWQRVSAQITPSTNISDARIRIESVTGDITIYLSEYQIEEGSEATAYEPYSNICPISGHTDVTVTVASTSGGSGEDTTVSLGRTVYGGNLDVTTGELEVTWENIASYAGETLTGEWLSSLDEYSTLGTPTTGAQVVYELATPQTFNLTPTQVKTLLGQNYVSHDGGGTISLVYVKGDAPIKPNPADAEIPLTGLEINGEKFSIPQPTEDYSDLSHFTWSEIAMTTSASSAVAIPQGTKILVVMAIYNGKATIVGKETMANINKALSVTQLSTFILGGHWRDQTSSDYGDNSAQISNGLLTAYSSYATITTKVYALT